MKERVNGEVISLTKDNQVKTGHMIHLAMKAGHTVLYDLDNLIAYGDINNDFANGVYQQSYATIVGQWAPHSTIYDIEMFKSGGWKHYSYTKDGSSFSNTVQFYNGAVSIKYNTSMNYDNWAYDIITYPDGKSYKIPVK